MQTDEVLIEKVKRLFEASTGWGDSTEWTNQDFLNLSDKIQEKTNIALSHVTLKRVWGKVKYESLPNTHTLDTLVQYLGYENWREFKSQNNAVKHSPAATAVTANATTTSPIKSDYPVIKGNRFMKMTFFVAGPAAFAMVLILILGNKPKPVVNDKDYSFSSKKVISQGVPNSVIFNYDATKSPYDTVIIQQSWDKRLQAKVPKDAHQHTSIYYYPDYYNAKLIVGGRIVSTHKLLIKSNGWMPIVTQSPVPVYFDKAEAMVNGKLSLPVEKMKAKNIEMQPKTPYTLYSNVMDFGEIYSDDFVFETSLKNDYREGAAVCQSTVIYILCEGTAIGIPLCSKGCVSDLDLLFTDFYTSGKQEDLSAFGVDFNSYVGVKVISKNGKADIYLNDKLAYTVKHDVVRSKIIGFDLSFQGTGSVDYIHLTNGKVNYRDDF